MSMQQYAAAAGSRIYAYFKCSRLSRFGKDGCCSDRVRTNHRAEEIEGRVWEFVSNLMKDPEELRADLETMIEFEKRGAHGDPEREAKAWLDKLYRGRDRATRLLEARREGLHHRPGTRRGAGRA
jgi:hypothetical protein